MHSKYQQYNIKQFQSEARWPNGGDDDVVGGNGDMFTEPRRF